MAASVSGVPSGARTGQVAGVSRVLELDSLRAIAILLVLGCHYPGFANRVRRIPEFGWVGVDIFFALSGYLITTILLGLRGRRTPYRTFYARRAIRILPPYLAATLFLLIIAIRDHWQVWNFLGSQLLFLQAMPQDARDFFIALIQNPKFHLTHLAPLLANAHALPPAGVGLGVFYASAPLTYWSLSIEEYFYLLWAPIVLRCSRRTIVLIAAFACLTEMLIRWMDGTDLAYFRLICRFDALLYGAFVAILFEHWRKNGTPRWATSFFTGVALFSCGALAAILFAIRPILGLEVRASVLFTVFGYSLISIAVSAVIGLFLLRSGSDWWLARIFRSRLLLFIGTISYTMYLVHVIAGTWVLNAVGFARWHWSQTSLAVASSLLTILVAYASWHWLEKPMLRWKDRHFPNSPHPAEPELS